MREDAGSKTGVACTVAPCPNHVYAQSRTHLMDASEEKMALATANSILLMRGIRGFLGVRWLSPELATPESSRLLASIDPTAMDRLLAAIVAAHRAEVQRQGGSDEARMFPSIGKGGALAILGACG